MENDFCEERGPVGPVDPEELDCLMFLVKTTIERMFPINPKIEIVVNRIPSMIKVARSFCSWLIISFSISMLLRTSLQNYESREMVLMNTN